MVLSHTTHSTRASERSREDETHCIATPIASRRHRNHHVALGWRAAELRARELAQQWTSEAVSVRRCRRPCAYANRPRACVAGRVACGRAG
jgi:hypothetical protein